MSKRVELEGNRIEERGRKADWFDEEGKTLGQALGNCIWKAELQWQPPNVRGLQKQMFASHLRYMSAKDGWECAESFLQLSPSLLDPSLRSSPYLDMLFLWQRERARELTDTHWLLQHLLIYRCRKQVTQPTSSSTPMGQGVHTLPGEACKSRGRRQGCIILLPEREWIMGTIMPSTPGSLCSLQMLSL